MWFCGLVLIQKKGDPFVIEFWGLELEVSVIDRVSGTIR